MLLQANCYIIYIIYALVDKIVFKKECCPKETLRIPRITLLFFKMLYFVVFFSFLAFVDFAG